jgi:hypothetical protein
MNRKKERKRREKRTKVNELVKKKSLFKDSFDQNIKRQSPLLKEV